MEARNLGTRSPLEPSAGEMRAVLQAVSDRAVDFVEQLPRAPAQWPDPLADETRRTLLAPPPEVGAELAALLSRIEEAAASGVETGGGGHLGWIPGGGLYTAAVAEFYAQVLNRYVTLADISPGLAALEHGVGRWLAKLCGMPATAVSVLTSGGSIANFSAVVAARESLLGEQIAAATLYTTAYTHRSLAKAARLAGIPAANVRMVATTSELRMDADAAAEAIAADRARGLRPFLLVGSAGTTDTGAIDPLAALAELCRREGIWFHVDAAYGGFFLLTSRGAERLKGLELADSVTLDPHKSLFMPYGTGALVVRDAKALRAAHAVSGSYLQDLDLIDDVPNFAELGPELTRECRGLRLWLPLHLHGLGVFRSALDEKLDLAAAAYDRLAGEERLDVPWRPDLTVVAFRRAGTGTDSASRRLLEQINAQRRIFLTSTTIDGRFMVRLCVLSHRTHSEHVDAAVDAIIASARR